MLHISYPNSRSSDDPPVWEEDECGDKGDRPVVLIFSDRSEETYEAPDDVVMNKRAGERYREVFAEVECVVSQSDEDNERAGCSG